MANVTTQDLSSVGDTNPLQEPELQLRLSQTCTLPLRRSATVAERAIKEKLPDPFTACAALNAL